MKSTLFIGALVVSGLAGAAHANVGVFAGSGHSIELSSTEDIRMVSEDVTIIPGRGRFLFDGSVAGMDRVEYYCTFVLKNLKSAEVTIQAGFPLNTQFLSPPYDNKSKTSELVAQYSFIAQEEEFQYSVRYVAGDRKKKLKNLFLWDMTFAPGETRTVRVTYALPMSMTLASTALKRGAPDYGKKWIGTIENCLLEWFEYVTQTGGSWSGKIGKARFRVYVGGFEEYLRRRPFMEETDEENLARTREAFPVRAPISVRITAPTEWTVNDNGFLELSFEDYEPTENLRIRYYILPFPRAVDDAKRLMAMLAPDGMSAEDRQDLADIFREFNGTKTGNGRIVKFLENQVWFGKPCQEKIADSVLNAVQEK